MNRSKIGNYIIWTLREEFSITHKILGVVGT